MSMVNFAGIVRALPAVLLSTAIQITLAPHADNWRRYAMVKHLASCDHRSIAHIMACRKHDAQGACVATATLSRGASAPGGYCGRSTRNRLQGR
jgi:hypothetical protein